MPPNRVTKKTDHEKEGRIPYQSSGNLGKHWTGLRRCSSRARSGAKCPGAESQEVLHRRKRIAGRQRHDRCRIDEQPFVGGEVMRAVLNQRPAQGITNSRLFERRRGGRKGVARVENGVAE